MNKRVFLIITPIVLGLVIAGLALAAPAQANPLAQTSGPDHWVNQVYGTLESFPANQTGDWVVDGVAYTADQQTTFREEHGPFEVGACVEVEYLSSHSGGNQAVRIQTEYAYKCQNSQPPFSKTSGIVITFPEGLVGTWVVDTTTFTATENTRFEQEEGPFTVGGCVKVIYQTSNMEAVEISTQENEDCGGHGEQHLFGIIDQTPPSQTITGTWVISGVDFIATPSTRIMPLHGPVVEGACAKVEYRVVNGQNIADRIKSEWMFLCTGPVSFNQVYGTISSFPPDLYGTWVISSTGDMTFTFMTDPSTRFKDHRRDFAVGDCIKVKYFTLDGVNHAVEVKTTRNHLCQQIDIAAFSKMVATIESMPLSGTYTGTWTLAGVAFTATADTRFESDATPLAVGDCAETRYDPASGGMLLKKVEEEYPYHCQAPDGSDLFRLFGVVEAMPVSGTYTGTWQISGVPIEAISSTVIGQDHGLLTIGAYVAVKFVYDPATGMRTATEINTHVAPGFGWFHHFGHLERIDAANAPDALDRWTIDGVTYLADPGMELGANLKVGSLVYVNAYESNGSKYATQLILASASFLPVIQR